MSFYHPAFGHPINATATEVSDDPDTQVAQTIALMDQYSSEDARSPEVLEHVRRTSYTGDLIIDSFRDVQRRIRFAQDEETAAPFASWMKGPIVEILIRPVDMLRMRDPQEDCDGFAMSLRSMLLARGIPAGFRTRAVDPDEPGRYSHVYAIADCRGGKCGPVWDGIIPLDASHGRYPGWECPNPYGRSADWALGGSWLPIVLWTAGVGLLLWWAFK